MPRTIRGHNVAVPPDGRFAPSPTGPLHLGSLRTALAAWLFARSQGARFLLRIEDLDPQRSRREFARRQIADLQTLGIDWDETPVRQSERTALYEEALIGSRPRGACIPVSARAPRSARRRPRPTATCRKAPIPVPAERCRGEQQARMAAGRPFALRLRADAERIEFEDRLLGCRTAVIDDFVVRRADGVPAYQLAVVVDDAAQGIREVVRGEDLADSTPRQILLARLLGSPVPAYAHVPLVLGPDGARLAKRHGAATLEQRAEPAPATLAFLAHTLGLALEPTGWPPLPNWWTSSSRV